MSGSWRKSVGTETRASGHTSQIFCRTLRQLLVVGSPRLPKRSQVSALTARPPKSLRRENRLSQRQRLCGEDDRTGSGDRNLALRSPLSLALVSNVRRSGVAYCYLRSQISSLGSLHPQVHACSRITLFLFPLFSARMLFLFPATPD